MELLFRCGIKWRKIGKPCPKPGLFPNNSNVPTEEAPHHAVIPPEVQEAESQDQREAKRYYAARWQELSHSIQTAIPDILPERLPIAVAAIAISKWDIPTAAAILSQSEAGKKQQGLGKPFFREWLRKQLEAAVKATQQQAQAKNRITQKAKDGGR